MARILVVDDYKSIRMLLKEVISEAGHEVVAEAGNGMEAIEYYEYFQPDLVTMDITMPIMDGICAARKIIKLNPQASIVLCSSLCQKDVVLEAVNAGVKDFIIKPFDKDKVTECIKNILCS